MVRIDYEPSEVLISQREPFNKNTVWIHPLEDNIQIKIFDRGWKVLSQTKDTGLSDEAKNQIEKINLELKALIIRILKKQLGKFSSSSNVVYERQKMLEERIKELEDKFDKLNKKYSTLRK